MQRWCFEATSVDDILIIRVTVSVRDKASRCPVLNGAAIMRLDH